MKSHGRRTGAGLRALQGRPFDMQQCRGRVALLRSFGLVEMRVVITSALEYDQSCCVGRSGALWAHAAPGDSETRPRHRL